MRLYIIRHADPDYVTDELTAAGRREARALAERLQDEKITRLYSSPMGRALDTAEYARRRLGLELDVESWMREREEWWIDDGPMDEWPAWNVDGETVRRLGTAWSRESWSSRPPFDLAKLRDGFDELVGQSDGFLARHGYLRDGQVYRADRPHRERIATFCHGGFAMSWLAHLLEIPPPVVWTSFFLPPSSVTTVLFDERSPGVAVPRCLGVGDVSHLYKKGLPVRPLGIIANFD